MRPLAITVTAAHTFSSVRNGQELSDLAGMLRLGVRIIAALCVAFLEPSTVAWDEAKRQAALNQHVVTNLLPAHGSVLPARVNLCVQATAASGENLTLRFYGRDLSAESAEEFSLIALPDTQVYALGYPAIFNSQTAWIVAQRKTLNIPFVTQLGDIVELGKSAFEWQNADAALRLLEDPATTGLPDGIPYGIAVASHEQSHQGPGWVTHPGWTTPLYNQYFGIGRFEGRAYYGGHFGTNNDNSYQLFSASGMDFIILHLEEEVPPLTDLALRAQVLDWADNVLKTHSDRRAIISSHHLIHPDDASWTAQGQAIYDRLKHNPNLFLMLCAHLAGEPRRTDVFEGNTVHTLMSDYQFFPNGGNGFLRIYTFSPQNDQIRAATYSPWLDEFRVNPNDAFTLAYDMNGGRQFELLGVVPNVPSGQSACREWTGRTGGSTFEWYVDAVGSEVTTRGPVASFSSDGSCLVLADCDDRDPCTSSTCRDGSCKSFRVRNCCEKDGDCDDDNPCTDERCYRAECRNVVTTHACWDGNACTTGDVCNAGVCTGMEDACDDGNACTLDICFEEGCQHEFAPASGCCAADFECHDADPCTVDSCDAGGSCLNVGDPACCRSAAECDDGIGCNVDTCGPTNWAALRLNGSEHVTMKPTGLWPVDIKTGASVFTVELWFKWDGGGSVAGTSELQDGGLPAYPLVTRGRSDDRNAETDARNVNYFLGIRQVPHVLVADFEEHSSGSHPGRNHPVIGSTVIRPHTWHHAAASYDGNCWQLYLDGAPETDGSNCPGEPPNRDSISGLNFGSAQDFQVWIEGHFSGLVDEIRLWKRARSPVEIQANMGVQIATHPDLLGRWGLNEVEDLFVWDSSGNQQTGLAVGGSLETVDVVPLGGNRCSYTPESRLVLGLEVRRTAGATELSWTELGPGSVYDLVSGTLADLRSDGSSPQVECLVDDTAALFYNDTGSLESGAGLFYLLRAGKACSGGGYGTDSSGQQRTPQNGCP